MLLAGSAFAQTSAATNTSSQLSSKDRTFIQKVSQDNLAEVKTAKMVEQKTNDPAIRDYAKDLVNDHIKAEQQLSTVATSLNVTLPRQPDAQQTAAYDHLKALSGKQLDVAFVKDNLKDHKSDIREFDQRLQDSQSKALKDYVAAQLPHLQDHIRIAEDLAGNMNMPGRAGLNMPSEAVSAQALSHSSQNLSAKNQSTRRPY
jgi:putative membrane protein